jgi:hypothetical protein
VLREKDGLKTWRHIGIKSNYEFGIVGYWKPVELYSTLPKNRESIINELVELKKGGAIDATDMTLVKISMFGDVPVRNGGPGKLGVVVKGLSLAMKK